MPPTDDTAPTTVTPATGECGIAAFATVEAPRTLIPVLRKNPAPHQGQDLPPSLLKYADEQTVVALTAVMRAIHDFGLGDQKFTEWGVVAAPCFLGREAVARAVDKFRRHGALGVSPILIPHLSLHAVAGTISPALHIHGPNVGVGGGKGSLIEALLTALALQHEHRLPGVWVVLSEWDPEPIPGGIQQESERALCRAVCLAVVPAAAAWRGLCLRVVPPTAANVESDSAASLPCLADLAHFLTCRSDPGQPDDWSCRWCGNGRLELSSRANSKARAA